jgi:hypothetical protein
MLLLPVLLSPSISAPAKGMMPTRTLSRVLLFSLCSLF